MAGADLTEQQREELQTLLGSPLEYPKEFKAWLPDFLAQNIPYLPLSQIAGHETLKPWYGVVLTGENTQEANVWGDLFATAGPRVDEVSGGTYLVIWGYYFGRGGGTSGGVAVKAGVSIDGNDPVSPAYIDAGFEADQSYFNWKVCRITVPTDGALHFVKLKYYFIPEFGGGDLVGHAAYRWLVLIRIK